MHQPKMPIRRIEVLGLHNDRDIKLEFDSEIKILVDENGSGKTTFLNLVVGVLQGNLQKIRRYDFQSVEIEFSDSKTVKLEKADFGFRGIGDDEIVSEFLSRFSPEIIEEIIVRIMRYPSRAMAENRLVEAVSSELGVEANEFVNSLRRSNLHRNLRQSLGNQRSLFEFADNLLKEKIGLIKEYFPYRILYFPTYRLVEENLHNLGYEKADIPFFSEQLIQFGMENVRVQWDQITQEMRNTSVDGFARVNGRMLDELTEEINRESIHYDKIADEDALALVLSRSGDSVSEKSRARILELVRSQEITNKKFEPLAYFLSNLIAIHESQKDKDDAINNFVRLINSYFRDKEVSYNARELSLQVLRKVNGQPIRLDRLSSGEKQIVSIFSRILLDFDKRQPFAIFFDEPELSLSVEWQEKLLKDIVSSEHTKFLLAATHSPFIYENDLLGHGDVLDIQMRSLEDVE